MSGISSKAAGKLENKNKYNGIEFDNDLDINTYEAFYRNLDFQIGRWWQIDPKADSLLGISPYNSMVNNPISIKDPKGDLIQFDENASGEYKAKVLVAAITLLIKGVGDNLIQLASSKRTYTFSESKTLESSFLGNKNVQGGVVSWNPNVGLLTSNQAKLSATTVLNHELDHATHYDNNPTKYFEEKKSSNYFDAIYDNIEEKRVVTGSEQRTAFAMGEIIGNQLTRTDHQTFGTIATQWPNSANGTVTPISGNLDNIIIKSKKSKSKN